MYLKSSQCNFNHPSKPQKYLTHSQQEINPLNFLPSPQKGLWVYMFCVIGSPITLLCRSTSTSNTSGMSPLNSQICLYFSSVAGIKISYFMILPKCLFLFLNLFSIIFPPTSPIRNGDRALTQGSCMHLSLWVEDKLSYNKQSLYQFHLVPLCIHMELPVES